MTNSSDDTFMNSVVASANVCSVTDTPIEQGACLRAFETWRIRPSSPSGTQTTTLYSNGPVGTSVDFELERVPNSGGHNHGGATREPLAVGTVSPASLTLTGRYPQNAPCVFTAPQCSGQVYFTFRFSEGTVIRHMFEVMYDSFLPVPQSTGIELKKPTESHPSGYWADPPFIVKLRQLGEQYYSKSKKNIVVTDASLPWGGRYDINAVPPPPAAGQPPIVPKPWDAPHAEHWNGRQADIRLSNMTKDDQKVFEAICTQLGIIAAIHSNNHYHIRLP